MGIATKQSKYTEKKFLRDIERILYEFSGRITQLQDVLKYEDIVIPAYLSKYTKEYFIQNFENNLVRRGVEDYIAVRGLINCTKKERDKMEDFRGEEYAKKALNSQLAHLPRYKLKQFLDYTDLCLIDNGIEPSLIRKGTPKCSEKDVQSLKKITVEKG